MASMSSTTVVGGHLGHTLGPGVALQGIVEGLPSGIQSASSQWRLYGVSMSYSLSGMSTSIVSLPSCPVRASRSAWPWLGIWGRGLVRSRERFRSGILSMALGNWRGVMGGLGVDARKDASGHIVWFLQCVPSCLAPPGVGG